MKRAVKISCLLAMTALFLSVWILFFARYAKQVFAGVALESHALAMKSFYKLDAGWPKFPEYFTGQVFGVAVNPVAGVVYVAQRGDSIPKVLMFTEDGHFLHAWNTTTIEMPHGIFVANASSPYSSVWVTDVGNGKYGHTVKQYTHSGNLLQILGTPGIPGSDLYPLQFDQPAEVFVDSKGEIYIVDGDGGLNNRLVKLSQALEVVWVRGEKGSGPSQFYIPHSVTVDAEERVWVADRGNKRIQAFDASSGQWIGSWNSCFTDDAPYSVRLTSDNKYFIVAQLNINRVSFLTVPFVGDIGECHIVDAIQMADDVKPHLVGVNSKTTSFYVAEIGAQQAQKFVPFN